MIFQGSISYHCFLKTFVCLQKSTLQRIPSITVEMNPSNFLKCPLGLVDRYSVSVYQTTTYIFHLSWPKYCLLFYFIWFSNQTYYLFLLALVTQRIRHVEHGLHFIMEFCAQPQYLVNFVLLYENIGIAVFSMIMFSVVLRHYYFRSWYCCLLS